MGDCSTLCGRETTSERERREVSVRTTLCGRETSSEREREGR